MDTGVVDPPVENLKRMLSAFLSNTWVLSWPVVPSARFVQMLPPSMENWGLTVVLTSPTGMLGKKDMRVTPKKSESATSTSPVSTSAQKPGMPVPSLQLL